MDHKNEGKQQDQARKPAEKRQTGKMHPAGPHARPELTDNEATPGTGALPDAPKDKGIDPGVG